MDHQEDRALDRSKGDSMQAFENRTAVVTGAASGIGLASAKAFAQLGMSVALLDIRVPELAAAVNDIRASGARAIGVTTDVSETESVEAAALQVEHTFGRVHLVMNNAAVFLRGLRMDVAPDAAWEWIVGVNLYGVIRVVRSFLPLIRAHGQDGHVINTASISGLVVGDRESGAYSATKFAVIAFSEALEHDLKGTGIGVSVVIPGRSARISMSIPRAAGEASAGRTAMPRHLPTSRRG
jgi:NAD(P)-dependent dehydrogenase (short-subunit alcohol dehydrogenase family)